MTDDNKKVKRITLDLPDYLAKNIDELKKDSGLSQTEIVVRALEDYLFKQQMKVNMMKKDKNDKNITPLMVIFP